MKCKICQHPQRSAIDSALILGRSLRSICAEFTGVRRNSLHRHSRHVRDFAAKAIQGVALEYSKHLRRSMAQVQKATLEIMEAAKRDGDKELALRAASEARANAECMRKLIVKTAEPRKAKPAAETEIPEDVARRMTETYEAHQQGSSDAN